MTKKTINAYTQQNKTPEYAAELMAELAEQGFTKEDIAKRTGVHKRSIYAACEVGIKKFPLQCTLEGLAGRR